MLRRFTESHSIVHLKIRNHRSTSHPQYTGLITWLRNCQPTFHETPLAAQTFQNTHVSQSDSHKIWKSSVQNQRYRINEVRQRCNRFVGRASPSKGATDLYDGYTTSDHNDCRGVCRVPAKRRRRWTLYLLRPQSISAFRARLKPKSQ